MTMFEQKLRREPRHDVRNADLVRVTLETPQGESQPAAIGRLQDISRGGFMLVVDRTLPFQEAILLTLESDCFHLSVPAEVCWMQSGEGGKWLVGGRIAPRLPLESFEQLLHGGLTERRSAPRESCRQAAMVKWELESKSAEAIIWDHSLGGFSLLCANSPAAGDRVMLSAASAGQSYEVYGRAVWSSKIQDGCFVGCSFVAKDGHAQLLELLEPIESSSS